MKAFVPALLGAALLAGCATSANSPRVVATKAELAAVAPTEWMASPAWTAPPAQSAWELHFGDPALARLIEEALAANPDLRAAAYRVGVAEADAAIAGADLYPSLGVGGSGQRSKEVFVGFPIDLDQLPDEEPPGEGSSDPLSVVSTRLGVSLDLSWELDLWGRLRAGKEAATGELEAARFAYDGARLSLAGQTAKAWFAVLEAREQLELADKTLASWRTTEEQVSARYERGLRSPLDLRFARTQVAASEARAIVRRQALDRVARQLEVLLGRYPSAELAAASPSSHLSGWPAMPAVPAGVPLDVLARRPDLMRAEQRVFAADRRVWAAKASLLPRIAITGSAGSVSEDFAHLLDGDFGVWSLAANLVQPIFEGGRLRGAVRKAKSAAGAEAADYVSTALVAFTEVENALSGESYLAQTEQALERASIEAAAAERLASERYRSGIEGYVTLLESSRSALQADSALIEARRQRLENRVDLVLALGGGIYAAEPAPGGEPQAEPGLRGNPPGREPRDVRAENGGLERTGTPNEAGAS
jgi:outer membrane protein, multidrug efflux system